MIKFEKVPFKVYLEARRNMGCVPVEEIIEEEWEDIKLPTRSTVGSAGYDFFAPFKFTVFGEDSVPNYLATTTIPTGVRFVTDRDDIFLMCVPRSGLGFRDGFRLVNTVGVIDSDYQFSDNNGHIMGKFASRYTVDIEKGRAYMQGIIVPFIKTDDDFCSEHRNGGFGSTDKK